MISMVQPTKVPGVAARQHLTVSQPRLPNLLDRVLGVTTSLGWCPSPALIRGKYFFVGATNNVPGAVRSEGPPSGEACVQGRGCKWHRWISRPVPGFVIAC